MTEDKQIAVPKATEEEIVEIVDNRSKGMGIYKFLSVLVVCILVGVLFIYTMNMTKDAIEDVGKPLDNFLEGLCRENSTCRFIVYSQLDTIYAESKLLVSEALIDTRFFVEVTYDTWLPDFIDGRPTQVQAYFQDNKVQYVIDTEDISANDFRYDPFKRKLYIDVPSPRLDLDMVQVQTFPSQIEFSYQGNFWHPRDAELLEETIWNMARTQVLLEATNPLYMNEAERIADSIFVSMFTRLLIEADMDVEVVATDHIDGGEDGSQEIHSTRE